VLGPGGAPGRGLGDPSAESVLAARGRLGAAAAAPRPCRSAPLVRAEASAGPAPTSSSLPAPRARSGQEACSGAGPDPKPTAEGILAARARLDAVLRAAPPRGSGPGAYPIPCDGSADPDSGPGAAAMPQPPALAAAALGARSQGSPSMRRGSEDAPAAPARQDAALHPQPLRAPGGPGPGPGAAPARPPGGPERRAAPPQPSAVSCPPGGQAGPGVSDPTTDARQPGAAPERHDLPALPTPALNGRQPRTSESA